MFIKFCGFTRAKDVEFAAALSISAVGFIFHPPSKRNVSPDQALELGALLKDTGILKVGVFVYQSASEIKDIAEQAGLDMLQIYNHGLAGDLKSFRPLLFAHRIRENTSSEEIFFPSPPHLLLLDAFHPLEHGGTGDSFNWDFLDQLPSLDRTVIAGGITPHNVRVLLTHRRPYGIDISSGIESSPGIKDHKKMAAFIKTVQEKSGPVSPF